ncbi:hypothetical protein DXA95_01785 [Odoribacter sp. OF09-27XD]|jgi:hypothetical protein|nr:hypothetical protein [Odoribacter sp. OF09-27XD]RHV97958.1 hypothetical protein DXA95_01785 [Odoribacter sp. OF09-27XD]
MDQVRILCSDGELPEKTGEYRFSKGEGYFIDIALTRASIRFAGKIKKIVQTDVRTIFIYFRSISLLMRD